MTEREPAMPKPTLAAQIAAVQRILDVMMHHTVFEDVVSLLYREALQAVPETLKIHGRVVQGRDQLKRENEIISASLTNAENEAEKFRRDWERVRQQRDAMIRERDDRTDRWKKAEQERDAARAELASARGTIGKLRDLLNDQQELLAEAQIERLKEINSDLFDTSVALQTKIGKDASEIGRLRAPPFSSELLAEATAAVERMKAREGEDIDEWAKKLGADLVAAGESEYAPVSEDAMEVARAFAKRITAPRVGEDFIDALADMIARALTAAREAERERYRPLVEAARKAEKQIRAHRETCHDLTATLATLDASTPEKS